MTARAPRWQTKKFLAKRSRIRSLAAEAAAGNGAVKMASGAEQTELPKTVIYGAPRLIFGSLGSTLVADCS